jgi:hypothetical protein
MREDHEARRAREWDRKMTRFYFGLREPQDVDDGLGMTFDLAAFEAALWLAAAELSSKRPDLRGERSVVVTPTGRQHEHSLVRSEGSRVAAGTTGKVGN